MGRIVNYSQLSGIAKSNVDKAYAKKGYSVSEKGDVTKKKSSSGTTVVDDKTTIVSKTPGVAEAVKQRLEEREATKQGYTSYLSPQAGGQRIYLTPKTAEKFGGAIREEETRQSKQAQTGLGPNTYTSAPSTPGVVERARYRLETGTTGRTKLDELLVSGGGAIAASVIGLGSAAIHPVRTIKGIYGFGKEAVVTKGESVFEAGYAWGEQARKNPEIPLAEAAFWYGGSKALSFGINKLRTPKVIGSKDVAAIGRATEQPASTLFIKSSKKAGITKYTPVTFEQAVTPTKIAGRGQAIVYTKKPFGKVTGTTYGVKVKGGEIYVQSGKAATDITKIALKQEGKSAVVLKSVGKTTFDDARFFKTSKVYSGDVNLFNVKATGVIKGDVISQIGGVKLASGKKYVVTAQKGYKVLEVGAKEGYIQKGISASKAGFKTGIPVRKGFLELAPSEKQVFMGGTVLDLQTETVGLMPAKTLSGLQIGKIAEEYVKTSIPKTTSRGIVAVSIPSTKKYNYESIIIEKPKQIQYPTIEKFKRTAQAKIVSPIQEKKIKSITRQRRVGGTRQVNLPKMEQINVQRVVQLQRPIQMQRPIQTTKTITMPRPFGITPIPMFPPWYPLFPAKPPMGGGGGRRKYFDFNFGPKSKYQPSIVGAYLKIKTPKLKKQKWLSGLEIRGL